MSPRKKRRRLTPELLAQIEEMQQSVRSVWQRQQAYEAHFRRRGSLTFSVPSTRRIRGGRPAPSTEEIADRERVARHWSYFEANYRDLPTPRDLEVAARRGSVEHFVAWALECFDDMPTDDPHAVRRLLDAHRKAKRRTK
jgi:hypothetical protein